MFSNKNSSQKFLYLTIYLQLGFSAAHREKFTMGNSNFRCIAAGHRASEENGPPFKIIKCKDMEEAIKQGIEYVEKAPKRRFCTAGSNLFLQCWELTDGSEAKFEKTTKDFFLFYYHGALPLEKKSKDEINSEGKYSYAYLYYEN